MEFPTCGKRPSFIRRGKSLHQIQPSLQGVSEKLLKNGEHKSPDEHTFMSLTRNQQCSVRHFFWQFLGDPIFITNKTNTRTKRLT